MPDLSEEFAFLKDTTLDPELKKVLIEKLFEERSQKREMAVKAVETNATQSLERKRFWHNTPLVVALVGTITVGANAVSSAFLNNQNSRNGERLKQIESQLAERGKNADASREATKEERTFAFGIIDKELAKSADMTHHSLWRS